MDFSKMTDAQLVIFRDTAQNFHRGISGDIIRLDRSNMQLSIRNEPRLNDLIWSLFVEAHNELCKRFKAEIKDSNQK